MLQGKPFLIHDIATALGMENAKTSPVPESISEKLQDDDDEPLTPSEARTFTTCVGKAVYLSHHRPDIQHSVNTLSSLLRSPMMTAKRRLRKLTRYLLGTSDVYQELIPDPHAEPLQVPVDSDWADDKETAQSCSGGAVLFHGCAVVAWSRTQKTKALSSAEAVRDRLRSNQRLGPSTTFTRMAVHDSAVAADRLPERARSVQAQSAGSNETCRAEDAHSGGMAENWTTSSSQSIDSQQPSRPHDKGHDSRETGQVWTCLELARITLHRLEPTCTAVTAVKHQLHQSQKPSQLRRTQSTYFSITDSQRTGDL